MDTGTNERSCTPMQKPACSRKYVVLLYILNVVLLIATAFPVFGSYRPEQPRQFYPASITAAISRDNSVFSDEALSYRALLP